MRFMLMAAAAVTAMVMSSSFSARAGELDGEKSFSTEQISLAQDLPKTVVVRVKAGTNQAEVLHVKHSLKGDASTHQFVSTSSFIKLDSQGKMKGELDRDSSSSSWYFYCPNYYYPTYYYYGYTYNYSNYYSYYYGGYNYYYYGWPHC